MKVKKTKKKKQKKLILVTLIVVFVLCAGTAALSYFLSPVDKSEDSIVVRIESGSTLDDIATVLAENNLIRNKTVFKLYIRIRNKQNDLQAGRYTLSETMSTSEITEKLIEGQVSDTIAITIREGLDLNRIGDYLESTGLFTKQEFLDEIKNNFSYYQQQYPFLASVPADREYGLEGYLFGDTYEVYDDATPRDVIEKCLDQFGKIFKDEYYARCNELGMTVDQVVTMASVVEREGILDDELPTIASVFYNRLDDGMKLQSCATLQYIYQDYQFTFTSSQMAVDNPYNTYLYYGLPAGPISNFRETALEAALYPANTDYYYFCSKNDGTGASAFASTAAEHEANVEKYSGSWN
ncbi:MAG: endolytic transglycosylase MltG [Anaerofustis sp.]